MLNILRITDLPQVAGLLWPARLVFLQPAETCRRATVRPTSYLWTEDLYARLGEPGAVLHLDSLSRLQPR